MEDKMTPSKIPIGTKFSKLTVVKKVENHITPCGTQFSSYLCNCDCGKKNIKVLGKNLLIGNTTSCGCYGREQRYKAHKKQNKYDLSGEYGVGYDSKEKEFYFDLEDYDLIKDYCWNVNNQGYVVAHIDKVEGCKRKLIMIHKLITNTTKEIVVDHINRKPNDNRKENLRKCNFMRNSQNNSIRKDNTSGVIGVYWNIKSNKWMSYIRINKIQTNLGLFENKEEAIIVRLKAEKEYYGEFAPQRDLFEKYKI